MRVPAAQQVPQHRTWVSDDGTFIRHEVTLDGFTGPDGTVRAGYRPDAELGSDVVHTSFWIDAGPVMAFGLAIWTGGMFVNELRKWRVLRRRRRPRRTPPAGATEQSTG